MAGNVLTIDVGGTFIKYGIIDENGELSKTSKVKTPYESVENFLETLQKIYQSFDEKIAGIALSVPGKIDVDNGVMLTSGALTYLEGLELASKLSPLCDNLPVSLENDAKAAALCESFAGAAKDNDSCVVIIFGSGIGGGIVLNKQVLRGPDLIAGEFSPVFVSMAAGQYNCFAGDYSTLTTVAKVQKVKGNKEIDGEAMMQMYRNNDQHVVAILEEWFEAIAKFCYNIDVIINPEVICIGGGISQDPLFVEKISEKIDLIFERKDIMLFRKPIVKTCKYHNDSNLIGAYYAFLQHFKNK